jgi:hypothetical protein
MEPSPKLLFGLPQELRDMIYLLCFSHTRNITAAEEPDPKWVRFPRHQQLKYHYSIIPIPQPHITEKTGEQIVLKRKSGNTSTHLNLLLSCKQVYFEFKDLVWKVNVFCCQERFTALKSSQQAWSLSTSVSSGVISGISGIGQNIRRLELHANLLPPTRNDLQLRNDLIRRWSTEGSLKELTLAFPQPPEKHCCMASLLQAISNSSPSWTPMERDTFVETVRWFQEACGENGYLRKVKRKIVIDTKSFRCLQPSSPCRSFNKQSVLDENMPLLSQINRVFGGELWVNGVLCFKDGSKRIINIY